MLLHLHLNLIYILFILFLSTLGTNIGAGPLIRVENNTVESVLGKL